MPAARQFEFAEDVGMLGRLVLRGDVDVVGLLGVGAGAGQNEFCPLVTSSRGSSAAKRRPRNPRCSGFG